MIFKKIATTPINMTVMCFAEYVEYQHPLTSTPEQKAADQDRNECFNDAKQMLLLEFK